MSKKKKSLHVASDSPVTPCVRMKKKEVIWYESPCLSTRSRVKKMNGALSPSQSGDSGSARQRSTVSQNLSQGLPFSQSKEQPARTQILSQNASTTGFTPPLLKRGRSLGNSEFSSQILRKKTHGTSPLVSQMEKWATSTGSLDRVSSGSQANSDTMEEEPGCSVFVKSLRFSLDEGSQKDYSCDGGPSSAVNFFKDKLSQNFRSSQAHSCNSPVRKSLRAPKRKFAPCISSVKRKPLSPKEVKKNSPYCLRVRKTKDSQTFSSSHANCDPLEKSGSSIPGESSRFSGSDSEDSFVKCLKADSTFLDKIDRAVSAEKERKAQKKISPIRTPFRSEAEEKCGSSSQMGGLKLNFRTPSSRDVASPDWRKTRKRSIGETPKFKQKIASPASAQGGASTPLVEKACGGDLGDSSELNESPILYTGRVTRSWKMSPRPSERVGAKTPLRKSRTFNLDRVMNEENVDSWRRRGSFQEGASGRGRCCLNNSDDSLLMDPENLSNVEKMIAKTLAEKKTAN